MEFESPRGNFTHIYTKIRLKYKLYRVSKKKLRKTLHTIESYLCPWVAAPHRHIQTFKRLVKVVTQSNKFTKPLCNIAERHVRTKKGHGAQLKESCLDS